MLTIKTNHQWRDFYYRNQVPSKVLKTELDWLSEDDIDGYFKYKNQWYHLDQFMLTHSDLDAWDGYIPDSAFSGVVIEVSADGEQYKIGTYYS